MEKIVTGNFENLAPEHKGWVWEHFMDPNLEENDIPNLCFIHKCALVLTLLLTQFYHPIEDTETANQIRDLTVAILTYDIDNIKFTNNPIQDTIALVTATNLIVILPFNTELHQRPQHLDIPYYQYFSSTAMLLGLENLERLGSIMFVLLSNATSITDFIATVQQKSFDILPLTFDDNSLRHGLYRRYRILYDHDKTIELIR